jgi:hypothetical protein
MYENRKTRLLSRRQFAWRLIRHFLAAAGIVGIFLAVGMWGYAHFEKMGGRDAFLNAAMILGGMGPVDQDFSPGGKIFAGVYALVSGLVFVAVVGLMLAPVIHRLMHQFHWSDDKV